MGRVEVLKKRMVGRFKAEGKVSKLGKAIEEIKGGEFTADLVGGGDVKERMLRGGGDGEMGQSLERDERGVEERMGLGRGW